jgi:acyl carrier protein
MHRKVDEQRVKSVRDEILRLVNIIHFRNGKELIDSMEFRAAFLDSEIGLNSLDLAEILTSLESCYGHEIMEVDPIPKTWDSLVSAIIRR